MSSSSPPNGASATTTTTTASSSRSSSNKPTTFQIVLNALASVALLQVLYRMSLEAYKIRLYAIQEYGRVIHEFDPYFNYRAAEYLWAHGWKNFSTWFDTKVWYPLGRPVGTTIYPGMQVTSMLIKQYLLPDWSINDICCFVPAWFGVTATLGVAWLTYECVAASGQDFTSIFNTPVPVVRQVYQYVVLPIVTGLLNLLVKVTGSDWGLRPREPSPLTPLACAVAAAAVMSIVPAHLLRSIGGGYDNESVAMTAMALTFACWTRSLRSTTMTTTTTSSSNPYYVHALVWGALTGVAYFNMVAAWGGYVFVLNLIGIHAGVLVLLGRYSSKLHRAYSAFYIVGTALAIQVPVVGWTPLKSLEQMGPLIAFGGLQLIELCEYLRARQEAQQRGNKKMTPLQVWKLRLTVFLSAGAVAAVVVFMLAPTGYFGPISSRVRGLFVKHTKTGNPLVDSVAEHQAANPEAYWHYLNTVMYLAPLGFAITALFFLSDSSSFLLVYGTAAYFFSHRMVRLILLTAPIASSLAGIVLGRFCVWMFASLAGDPIDLWSILTQEEEEKEAEAVSADKSDNADKSKTKDASRSGRGKAGNKSVSKKKSAEGDEALLETKDTTQSKRKNDPIIVKGIRLALSAYAVFLLIPYFTDFWKLSHMMAHQISHPSIIQKGQMKDGTPVVIDDYREAYFWVKDNTPEDARIMAWWDYGYQITGISDRTTIADGNTWNHEHIAFLGRTLTSPEKEAHRIARHLADYVLVWSGGGGDDLAKSPHLRRIANSVFRGLCSEPTCRDFGFYSNGGPTEHMAQSLLYKLVRNGLQPGVSVDPNRFKEVYRTKYGKVRIYKILSVSKESKDWVADPANRVCDAPGSWLCRGQYPPALEKILKEKKDFKQLEDFNVKGEDDSDYQREYMENLMKGGPQKAAAAEEPRGKPKKPAKAEEEELTEEDIDLINGHWENDERTTVLWQLVSEGHVDQLRELFRQSPSLAHLRSEDGRGPMWWAHEYGKWDIVELLKSRGVSEERKDSKGVTPLDLSSK